MAGDEYMLSCFRYLASVAAPRSGFEIFLKKDGKPVTWKVTGKDGWLYPAKLYETVAANNQRAAPGTAHDYEFIPEITGD